MNRLSYVGSWVGLCLTIPVCTVIGILLAQGQDPAGKGMLIGFAMLLGELMAAGWAALLSVQAHRMRERLGAVLYWVAVTVPWALPVGHFYFMGFTTAGDRCFEVLERWVP